jgi:alpha-galactosidase
MINKFFNNNSFARPLGCLMMALAAGSANAAIHVTQPPNHVRVVTETAMVDQAASDQATVTFTSNPDGLQVHLSAPGSAVKSVELHWPGTFAPTTRFLGDSWERAYADLGWRPIEKSGAMPWYFLASDTGHTDGYGVMTGPGAMCHWTVDSTGITLIADVRCGGSGVQLGNRTLDVCTVVTRTGKENEDAFDAAVAFCRQMCPHPRLPKMPVYGFNDWNSTYGHNTAEHFERDAAVLASLAPEGPNRPFMVVDDGWQANRQGGKTPGNPWDRTNARFGSSMAELSTKVKQLHAHPGLWYRPLEAWSSAPLDQKLHGNKEVFDPSVPAVRQRIVEDMRCFRGWGIELVKHDFSTYELLGKWGKDLGSNGTNDGWAFADRSRTTAEIILDLYHAIREGGGDEMTIDGCNTVSHLSAGVFELARIGDDTSGEHWDRNWQYGVNALAFRAPQQGAFYAVDPDMVALAKAGAIPWDKNKQWLRLASHSGTTLFVSWKVELMNDEVKAAIKDAFAVASKPQPLARPLDWMQTVTPTRWMLDGKEEQFAW